MFPNREPMGSFHPNIPTFAIGPPKKLRPIALEFVEVLIYRHLRLHLVIDVAKNGGPIAFCARCGHDRVAEAGVADNAGLCVLRDGTRSSLSIVLEPRRRYGAEPRQKHTSSVRNGGALWAFGFSGDTS